MKRKLTLAMAAVAGALGLVACSDTVPNYSSLAPQKVKFVAILTGANEVPVVTTTGAGSAEFIREDSASILYTIVTTAPTDSVTMVHIHAGPAGANGPIMLWFFPNDLARAPGTGGGFAARLNGTVRVSRITRSGAFFVAPFTWDSLMTRMGNGTAYVNLHTRRNPGGELRGQVIPAP